MCIRDSRRGIDYELIDFCIQTGRLYESYPYHNVVFVGMDADGKPRYANHRGIGSDFIGDANGSDKHYSVGIPAAAASDTLCSCLLYTSGIHLLMQMRTVSIWNGIFVPV